MEAIQEYPDKEGVDSTSDIEALIEWACLATAHLRQNILCTAQHRRTLIARGEATERIEEISRWRTSDLFSAREKSVFGLSQAITVDNSQDKIRETLEEARRHLNPEELVRCSASITAVNEWIELKGAAPIRVIVVEDNPDDQELLNRQLRKTPFGDQVLFISDPRVALDLVKGPGSSMFRKNLIAIFLDVHLPYLNGIDLLRILRSIEGWEDVPVVIMTTRPPPDTLIACAELKVRAFVEKPVTMEHFTKVIAPLFHQPLNVTT